MGRHEDSPVQAGDIIAGKYRVERVLGVGGMGAVVAARHIDLDEVRAVKVMLPRALRVKETVERFMREAKAVVRLKNPHVVKVFDVGRLAGGEPYMVMEYLEGRSMKALLEAGPLPASEVVDYVLQALEAAADAHAAGLVHRDLKPSNLYLTEDPDGYPYVKVLDFGISKFTEGQAGEMTATSDVLGSPFYMSPEQMRSTKDVDARADLWSVGVILYQLLGGRVPFQGETITQVCLAVVQDEPAPLSEIRSGLPAELIAIVMRCLDKDIERRYQTAAELADDLEPFGAERSAKSVQRIRRRLGVKAKPGRPQPAAAAAARPAAPEPPRAPTAASAQQQRLESLRRVADFDDDEEPTMIQPPPDEGGTAVAEAASPPAASSGPAAGGAQVPKAVLSTIVMEDRASPDDDDDASPTIIQPAGAVLVPPSATPPSPGPHPTAPLPAVPEPSSPPGSVTGDDLAGAVPLASTETPVPPATAEAGASTAASWQQDGWPTGDELSGQRSSRRRTFVMLGAPVAAALLVAVGLLALRDGDGDSDDATPADTSGTATAAASAAPPQAGVGNPPAAMVEVAGGEYWIGCDPKLNEGCFDDEKPGRNIEVATFLVMHHEVSAVEYEKCVAAGACPKPGTFEGCTFQGEGLEAHPINCVTWEAARTYCEHRGWRLPTELEWEVAARGADRRSYPWGNEAPSCERAVIANAEGEGCGTGGPLATGARPQDASWAKVFDLGGNVREWTASDYEPYVGGTIDEDSAGKVNRGGSWMMKADEINTAHTRGVDEPSESRPDLGFRCAANR